MHTRPVLHGRTVLLTVAIPRDTFATLQGIASADATCSLDWLARFALVDFARQYADIDVLDFDQDGSADPHTLPLFGGVA